METSCSPGWCLEIACMKDRLPISLLKRPGTTQTSESFSLVPFHMKISFPHLTYSAPAIENPPILMMIYQKGFFYQFWQVIQPNFDLCFYACVCRWQGSMKDVSVNHSLLYFSNLGISLNLKLANSARVGIWSTNSKGCPCLHLIAPWLQVQIPKADSY